LQADIAGVIQEPNDGLRLQQAGWAAPQLDLPILQLRSLLRTRSRRGILVGRVRKRRLREGEQEVLANVVEGAHVLDRDVRWQDVLGDQELEEGLQFEVVELFLLY